MIKFEIVIKEKDNLDIDDFCVSEVKVKLIEKGFNETKSEKETSEIIKKRLNLQQKIEILENEEGTEFSQKLNELLKYFK